MDIEFKKTRENAVIPERINEFAGGWDVTASEIERVSDDFYICKLGFELALPRATKLTITPRSGITKTKWIMQNSPGLGDEDYRGEYQIRFRALPIGIDFVSQKLIYPEFPYKENDRVGQIYLETVIPIEFKNVVELSKTARGDGGFGHSGN